MNTDCGSVIVMQLFLREDDKIWLEILNLGFYEYLILG